MWAPLGQKRVPQLLGVQFLAQGWHQVTPDQFMEWKGSSSVVSSRCNLLEVSSLASAGRTVSMPPTSKQPLATTYSVSLNRVTQQQEATSSLTRQRHRPLTGYKIYLLCWQIHLDYALLGWQQEDSFLYCGSNPLN